MKNLLFFIFVISIVFPVYTYVVYPFLLTVLPKKKRMFDEKYETTASVVMFLKKEFKLEELRDNIDACNYTPRNINVICTKSIKELNKFLSSSDSDIVVFLGNAEKYCSDVIKLLLRPFSDENIGCVVGMQRKKPDENGISHDGIYWKYENYVRAKESDIGCVSGANKTLYAVKRELITFIPEDIQNLGYYLSMCVAQKGKDIYFEPQAVAYEKENSEEIHFAEHVEEAREYWKLLIVFWRMLFRRKSSFIYVSHRVMKWFVPFNMVALLVCSILLGLSSSVFLLFAILQITGYFITALWIKRKQNSVCGVAKILDIISYFVALNISFLIGLFKEAGEEKNA